MTDIRLRSDVLVELRRASAADEHVAEAAWVSTGDVVHDDPEKIRGLIKYLVANRHGTPFEHTSFTFRVEAPIFVFREWHRHRIASINEWSGRYAKMLPHFYTPDGARPLVNGGSSARPEFDLEATTEAQRELMVVGDVKVAEMAWFEYERRLEADIANEMARTVLPVSTYSVMYWTVNARGLMNFISLRTDARRTLENPAVFSRPQREIELGAEQVEAEFAKLMPFTHAAFVAAGRVAP